MTKLIMHSKMKYFLNVNSQFNWSDFIPKMFFFSFLFYFFGLHLKLNYSCSSLCPPCLQGDEIISLKIKLLTTNRWCADTRPISEQGNSNRNKSGVSKKIVKPLLKRKLKTISRNQRKMNVDTIPLRKICICYKANYMTRNLVYCTSN